MAKKPMTKSRIVSYFALKFELSKKSSAAILDGVVALAVFETQKTGVPPLSLYPSWDWKTRPIEE